MTAKGAAAQEGQDLVGCAYFSRNYLWSLQNEQYVVFEKKLSGLRIQVTPKHHQKRLCNSIPPDQKKIRAQAWWKTNN